MNVGAFTQKHFSSPGALASNFEGKE